MRNRFKGIMAGERNLSGPMTGNFKLHNKRCMCCERMEDEKTKLLSSKTKREY